MGVPLLLEGLTMPQSIRHGFPVNCWAGIKRWFRRSTRRAAAIPAAVDRTVDQMIGRALFEGLESRQLLSSAALSSGLLTVSGDSSAPNKLTVTLDSSGNFKANYNGASRTFSRSA